jgi:hypothetical protein
MPIYVVVFGTFLLPDLCYSVFMAKYWTLDREEFLEARYINFKRKKAFMESIDPTMGTWIMADLDSPGPNGRLLSDIIICDACNEDIRDHQFIMFEASMVYHGACARKRDWYKAPAPLETYSNVIELFNRQESRGQAR